MNPPSPGFYLRNMAVLSKQYPALAEELNQAGDYADGDAIQVETAASGEATLVFRGVYVHSKRDPRREAERLVENAAGEGGGSAPVLILGFGLGYAAEALVAEFPEKPVIIAEKHPALFRKAMEVRDFSALLSHNALALVLGGTGAAVTTALSLFESGPDAPVQILQNRALAGMDGDRDWYAGIGERARAWNSRTGVNRATQKRFGKRWVRNLARNLEAVRDIPGISRLEGLLRGKGIPVFLAAAGPSLDAAGPLLGGIHGRCVTVAVDTSLRFLLDRGINPDFVVSVDPQYWNFRHLDRAPAPGTRLIAESAVYPPCLRHPFGGVFLCGSFFPLGRFIEDRVDPKGDLGAGGSVATSAWDFVRILGARDVWTAGLDLSFPELRTHFRGAVFEEKSHTGSGRFNPAETWNFRALRDGQPFRAERKGGGTVLTDKRLSLYAAWFENAFGRFPEIRNRTLSAEGLDIKGLEAAPAEELLAFPVRRAEIDRILEEAYLSTGKDFRSGEAEAFRAGKYADAREALLRGLGEISGMAEDAALYAGKAAARNRQGRLEKTEQGRVLDRLDAAGKAIAGSAVKGIAGFLFPDTGEWEAETAGGGGDPLTRHLEFQARFYRALAGATGYNMQVLNGR